MPQPSHVARDGALGDLETELQQLAVDPRSAPPVLTRHPPNKILDLPSGRCPARRPSPSGEPPPVEGEARAMPADHCLGFTMTTASDHLAHTRRNTTQNARSTVPIRGRRFCTGTRSPFSASMYQARPEWSSRAFASSLRSIGTGFTRCGMGRSAGVTRSLYCRSLRSLNYQAVDRSRVIRDRRPPLTALITCADQSSRNV